MAQLSKEKHITFLFLVGISGWFIPGAGYFLLKEKSRAIIIFVTIILTFCIGLYIGSIGVIDPIGSWPWYIAQVMVSPIVAGLGHLTAGGGYPVYGRPNEIGQIYTSIAGLLNLLCIVNAIYLAHLRGIKANGG
ncbi:MAG: hypothetical protein KAS75_08760 [Planctomycetes bacterium]|nr:hypothetical protein [Planctomycetota bacterium]